MSTLHVPLTKVEHLGKSSAHARLNVNDITLGVLYEDWNQKRSILKRFFNSEICDKVDHLYLKKNLNRSNYILPFDAL